MHILFIDDEDVRHDLAEQILTPHHTIYHAHNYDETIEILNSYQTGFDLVMHDHDLGDFITNEYGQKEERTGSTIARWIMNNLEENKLPIRAIVHSLNGEGAKNIISIYNSMKIPIQYITFSEELLKSLIPSHYN